MPRWFAATFLAIGVVCLTVSFFMYRHAQAFAGRAERVDGRVVDVVREGVRPGERGGSYSSTFHFTTHDGRSVLARASVRSTTPRYRAGEKVSVLYDPRDPETAVIDSFADRYFLLIVLLPIGLGFAAVGAPALILSALRKRKEARLTAHGRLVEARVTGVIRLENGLAPWRITAEAPHPLTHEPIRLQSRNLYEDPSKRVEIGSTIKAWIDPDRPQHHWIDVSFLPGVRD